MSCVKLSSLIAKIIAPRSGITFLLLGPDTNLPCLSLVQIPRKTINFTIVTTFIISFGGRLTLKSRILCGVDPYLAWIAVCISGFSAKRKTYIAAKNPSSAESSSAVKYAFSRLDGVILTFGRVDSGADMWHRTIRRYKCYLWA